MRIYRYLEAQWGKKSLSDRNLRFSNPLNVNDPFEISPNFDASKFGRDFIKRFAETDDCIKEAWERLTPNLYPSFEKFREDWLRDIDKHVNDRMDKVPGNIKQQKEKFLQMYSNYWRFLSFSKSRDSILLWSHYGDAHKGIALEFETSDPYLSVVGQEDILEVVYSSEKAEMEPWNDVDSFTSEIRKATRSKALDWAYEQEVRILMAAGALNEDIYPFKENPVRGVYLGVNSSEQDLIDVAQILSDKYYQETPIFRGSTDPERFKIQFTKLDI